ncbi:methyltransferase domain-containing protein [Sodiomyces alkalinus F11]|uniref:Methyltransferase domain-containing protein n=1 Tax=Sodiomyces alkalinus (strain CBS 110278 / VKM F-3762 / F11) TaxID=1314773 RepID=A0A3N2PRF0_SODAK|nr:methyltransferase domain-containing protein [Sodiomyces alkalinus F11]ROT37050.1 methyltransferase domain-containing protein [Sodiomyces alkalinus F11]
MSQISRTYGASSVAELKAIYDDWATSYDKELAEDGQKYVAPAIASAYVLNTLGVNRVSDDIEILDAGCGTGLVGIELAKVGAKKIDGVDLSPGMLDVARATGAYRTLETVDLSQALPRREASYDVVMCVGTMTQGHVGPNALDEFIRVLKKGGFLVATILGYIWETDGYKARVQELVGAGKATFISADLEDYRRGANVQARMLVLQAN